MSKSQAEQLKVQGNEAIKGGNYPEAMLHYTHAIKFDPNNHLLYSNRSHAFLKMQQYYYAMEDAKQTIKLLPSWPKGFFRKGEVEYCVGNYASALMCYRHALILDPTLQEIKEAINRTAKELNATKKAAVREPWIFTAIGCVIGVIIVLADQFLTKQPAIQYLVVQFLLMVVFGSLGFLTSKGYRYLEEGKKSSLMEPPADLLGEFEGSSSNEEKETPTDDKETDSKTRKKGGAASARQRYKKGKS